MTVTLESLRGHMLDADSHLQVPPHLLDAALGTTFADILREKFGFMTRGTPSAPPQVEPDDENVWTLKMYQAPGACDADVRLRVLDHLGVDRQLLFPMAIPASMMMSQHPEAASVAQHHNDFVLDWASEGQGRLRPVAIVNMNDVGIALAEARRVMDRGAYAINIACGRPPAGLSPADPAWEPLWAMCAEAGVPVLLHIGGEAGFVDPAWGATDTLGPHHDRTNPLDGEVVGPASLALMPLAPQAFFTAIILDGVLERHPTLHLGAIEMTAQWVGPMAEMLDQKLDFFKRLGNVLSMKPSEYLSRQVRVTPFWWEPVGEYINRYGLEDVYVFSTDFPHVEGGTDPHRRFHASLSGHCDDVFEKFFVKNASLII